ncbi:MAG: hypothetical protein M0010_07985, partial [Actinomycetota bacterium]|nr:hypothetical protein [Actinomycetota bacterium]
MDRAWSLLDANRAAGLLTAGVDPALLQEPVNLLRLAFHPGGLPRISVPSRRATSPSSLGCVESPSTAPTRRSHPCSTSSTSYLPGPDTAQEPGPGGPLLGSFELSTRLGGVRLFTVIATLGAPIEVTSA